MMDKVIAQLIVHEGLRLKPYKCTAGKLTIGVGRNLDDKGITKEEAYILLNNDVYECIADLKTIFPKFLQYTEPRQIALIDLRFNLGPNRFRGFKKMIAAVHEENWLKAGLELVDSLWYRQVGNRAETVRQQIING